MILVYALMVGISTFVVTFFLLYLDGPFDILEKIRALATREASPSMPHNSIYASPFLAGLYACFYCMSTWVCIVISILYFFLLRDIQFAHLFPVFICGLGVSSVLNMRFVEQE